MEFHFRLRFACSIRTCRYCRRQHTGRKIHLFGRLRYCYWQMERRCRDAVPCRTRMEKPRPTYAWHCFRPYNKSWCSLSDRRQLPAGGISFGQYIQTVERCRPIQRTGRSSPIRDDGIGNALQTLLWLCFRCKLYG